MSVSVGHRRTRVSNGNRPRGAITVCHPVWRLESGGLERQLMRVARGLSRDAYRHVVVAREPGDPAMHEAIADTCELIIDDLPPDAGGVWSRRLARVLVEYRVDVLHVRGLTMLLDGLAAAELAGGVRVALSFHGFEDDGIHTRSLRRGALAAAIRRCDAAWAVSRGAADALAREFELPPQSLGVIPNGVDTTQFAPTTNQAAARRQVGLPLNRLIVLAVGNLKPIKGHADVLDAWARLRGETRQAVLAIAGRDCLNGQLQGRATREFADCDIRIVGEQRDIVPWYHAADAFVLPSRFEGNSNALLEAMACGLPVIATAIGGNVDAIDHDRTGLLVTTGDADGLARSIERVLTDASLRQQLGQAARTHVESNCSQSRMLATLSDRYESLATRADASRPEPAHSMET